MRVAARARNIGLGTTSTRSIGCRQLKTIWLKSLILLRVSD